MAAKKATQKKTPKRKPRGTASSKKQRAHKSAQPATVAAKSKAVKKKTAGKKSTAKPTPKPAAPHNTSVDSILKRFEKQRSAQERHLTSVRAKIVELESQAKAFLEQVVSLKQEEETTALTLATLDGQRDEAILQLLGRLGVKLPSSPSAGGKKKAVSRKSPAKKKTRKKSTGKKSTGAKSRSSSQSPIKLEATPLFDATAYKAPVNDSVTQKSDATVDQSGT